MALPGRDARVQWVLSSESNVHSPSISYGNTDDRDD